MTRWRFTQRYSSSYGRGALGDEAEFEDAVADAINRDAPGTLVPVIAQPVPQTSAPKPASARIVRKPDN